MVKFNSFFFYISVYYKSSSISKNSYLQNYQLQVMKNRESVINVEIAKRIVMIVKSVLVILKPKVLVPFSEKMIPSGNFLNKNPKKNPNIVMKM